MVSILDRGGGVYFALIRGFLQNWYAEKFAVLTWLIPTCPNPKSFDPSRFVLGEFFCFCLILENQAICMCILIALPYNIEF